MNSINTNLSALVAQKNMQAQNREMDEAMQRLSSGLRINTAADDAAGSAIASKMDAQVRSLDVAIRNSYDAISMTQTAEGALGEMENILQRVRELAVQASNSTLSQNDRVQIQAEVDALVSEIDKIATSTHFNNVKLLDGTNNDVTFQIGINGSDSMKVNLEKSDASALGLNSSTGVQKLTSERVFKGDYTTTATTTIDKSDIKINGFNAFAANFTADLTATSTNTAKTVADAINLNSGVHGATVNAFNTFTSDEMGPFNMTQTFTINSNTIALSTSYQDLTDNINESASGINATLNSNNTITLSNTNGADIIIGANASSIGFTEGTYTGFLEIENLDGSAVRIEAGSVKNGYTGGSGTIADVHSIGFNEFSVGGELETDVVSGTALVANEIEINDVLIGASDNGSAQSIAAAINELTTTHGVTADAKNEVELTLDFGARPSTATAFRINGTHVDLTAVTDATGMITKVNSAGIGDIRATMSDELGRVILTSEAGVDITLSSSDNDFIVGARNIHGDSITTGINNGTFDLDGLVDGGTGAATGPMDASSSSLLGEVVNSRVVLTQKGTNAANGASAKLKVTGTDSSGATLTEEIDFAAGEINKQILGTKVFHRVTALNITGGAAHATDTFDVGLIGQSGSFDDDSLHTTASNDAAGAITLGGTATSHASSLNGSVITITGNDGNYSGNAAVNFTVVGTDVHGATVTETIALNVNNGEVHGTTAFHTITSITTDKVLQSEGVKIGHAQVGERVNIVGNMTLKNDTSGPIKIQSVGADTNTNMTAGNDMDTILQKLGVQNQSQSQEVKGSGVSVTNLGDANSSIATIDKAIDQLSLFRSSFGAVENRIDASINNLTTLKVNTEAAKSRIMDADFASETSKLTKSQILSQAATSMLAQANASKQNLLALLQG